LLLPDAAAARTIFCCSQKKSIFNFVPRQTKEAIGNSKNLFFPS
jgi:hypothetical protein